MIKTIKHLLKQNFIILLLCCFAIIGGFLLIKFIIAPAYQNNGNQLYSSSLGYPSIKRRLGEPIPVVTDKVKEGSITEQIIGEGVCTSLPVLVPVIPMAKILEVYAKEGEYVEKGDLLATLNQGKALIKYESALLAVSTAESELERVKLGSAYVLAQERPELERINLTSLQNQSDLLAEKLAGYQNSYKKGAISRVALLDIQSEFIQAQEELQRAKLALVMAEKGVKQSLLIGENALKDAQQALAHRKEELTDYNVYAPASGVIDRVLINAGEYNQDSGKPGFLIASGLWFDAYFDQSDFPKIEVGQRATIFLEPYAGRLIHGTVSRIKPIVSFNSGGPEIARPLRPRGTGSPEWAATFKVRIDIAPTELKIIPGMTGFTRVSIQADGLVVSRAAVSSISSGKGVVHVVDEEGEWSLRDVSVGALDEANVNIIDGLALGDKVIVNGHWGLRSDDVIEENPH